MFSIKFNLKINLIQYDDAYSPPKTVEQVRKLVESDEVFTTFQIIGTPPNAAVQKYLNEKKLPQLLASTGATRFTDPKNFPWTIAFNPNYQSEAHIYAKFILDNHPNCRQRTFGYPLHAPSFVSTARRRSPWGKV